MSHIVLVDVFNTDIPLSVDCGLVTLLTDMKCR